VKLRRFFFERAYRRGEPPWDTGVTPPEVVEVVEGPGAITAGRALDLGCGTGTNVRYLAEHGFDAIGVDFSSLAIRAAREKLAGVPRTRVLEGDVTELASLGVEGPFDLVLDVGCFHSIPKVRRRAYARGVGRVTRPGALLLIWAFARSLPWSLIGGGVTGEEMAARFSPSFELERVLPGERPAGAAWYTFRRREPKP
jgi:SAM-dependent methyltransferase